MRKNLFRISAGCAALVFFGINGIAQEETEGTDRWKVPCEETVTLTTARNVDAMAFDFDSGDSIEDNLWTRSFKDKLNVEVVTEWVSGEYEIRLNQAIASDDLPDVFVVDSMQMNQLMDRGQLADLTDIYEEWGSDTLKKILGAEEDIVETAMRDGRLYAIPQLYSGYHPEMLWLRKDWMELLGAEAPETVDELEEILRGMKEISGGYSFAVGQDLESLYSLAIAWDAYPGLWLEEESGRLVYGATAQEMKNALAAWQRWYQEGIIKDNFGTLNFEAVKDSIAKGETGAMTYRSAWGWVYGVDEVRNLGVDAYFFPCEIPTVTGKKAVYPRTFKNNGYIVVNKNCKHPEAVLKLIDYYVYILNDAYQEGEMSYDEIVGYTSNNMQHATAPFAVTNSTDDYNRYAMIQEALETGDESGLKTGIAAETYWGIRKWREEKDPSCVGYALQFGGEESGVGIASRIIGEDRVLLSGLWGAMPSEMMRYDSGLNDILLEGFTRIIMGAEEVDYFDTLIAQWYAAGGQRVTDEVNELYR